MERLHVDLRAARVVVDGDAPRRQVHQRAACKATLDEPLHRVRRESEEALDAGGGGSSFEETQHGVAAPLPPVLVVDDEAAHLGVRIRVALELRARDDRVVASVHVVESEVYVAREHVW